MLFLLHLPKTGGQTLASRLASAFPPGRSSIISADILRPEQLASLADAYDFFAGHVAPKSLDGPMGHLKLITAVRDPVEQIISHYRHILREPTNPLNQVATRLGAVEFLERFSYHMFNFQARSLISAFRASTAADLLGGDDLWLLRHLEHTVDAIEWLVPTDRIDEFLLLWSMENERPIGHSALQVNTSPKDQVDSAALRAWLQGRPERFIADSVLWSLALRRYAAWRHALTVCHPGTGEPAAGCLAWSAKDGAAIWLFRDWHAPVHRTDGMLEWWAGPGVFSAIRVRRGHRHRLVFEIATALGVRREHVRLFRQTAMTEVPMTTRAMQDQNSLVVEADLTDSGAVTDLLLFAPEDITVFPVVAPALMTPRRSLATQNWRLE